MGGIGTASTALPLIQKAALRATFKQCNALTQPKSASGTSLQAPASEPTDTTTFWTESFPPKLDAGLIDQLRSKFATNGPSEIVTHDSIPSVRLLSRTTIIIAWVPWKFRLTMAKSEEVQSQRSPKIPKLETASLHASLVDAPPAIHISNNSMGVNGLRNLLAVHDFALAMCGAAHLVNVKAYSAKFLSSYSKSGI